MALLAVAFLGLFAAGLLLPQENVWRTRCDASVTVIWMIFIAEFVLRLVVAPRKRTFLRRNWLEALAVVVPALRLLRGLRLLRLARPLLAFASAGRGASLFRIALAAGRLRRRVRRFLTVSRAVGVAASTLLVVLLAAGGVLWFERGAPDADIVSFGDALWWSAANVTTVACDLNPVTTGGRIVAVMLMVYGVAVFGYFVSRAVTFIQRVPDPRPSGDGTGEERDGNHGQNTGGRNPYALQVEIPDKNQDDERHERRYHRKDASDREVS